MKREITKQEEQVYKLVHQDFEGLSTIEAAKIMDVTPRRIQQVLTNLKKKCNHLFPILTKRQAKDYHLYTTEGWTMTEIGEVSGRVVDTISKSIMACVKKGMPKPTKGVGMLRYNKSMDNEISERF